MNFNEYQKLGSRTIPKGKDKKLLLAEFTLALCEEAGESAGVLKKVIFHDHPYTYEKRNKLVEELGDTLWHISAICSEMGISLDDIACYNINKLEARYPNGFSTEKSVNRVD
jgi:NTP pyrophosphatase (non-canonical NTP hydrolase)